MSKDLNLFSLLNANNYFSVNREIAHKIGLHASIMLTEIIDKFCFFEKLGQLDDGWFYLKVQDAFERTTLGEKAQKAAISILIKLKLLQTKQRGIPAKRYFKISEENIQKWLKLKEYLRTSQKAELEPPKRRNNKRLLGGTTPIYKNPSKTPPPPPTTKQPKEPHESLPNLASPEEEEELDKLEKERPISYGKIKCREKWRKTTLEGIRKKTHSETSQSTRKEDLFNLHKSQASVLDGQTFRGFLVKCQSDRVELISNQGAHCVGYCESEDEWNKSMEWVLNDFEDQF